MRDLIVEMAGKLEELEDRLKKLEPDPKEDQKMPRRKIIPKAKPEEDWTAEDWRNAYNALIKKYAKLEENMRTALNHLGKAQFQLTNAI